MLQDITLETDTSHHYKSKKQALSPTT